MNNVAYVAILLAPALPATAQSATREIAVTFDDLPIVSRALDRDVRAQKVVTARLLDTLAAFHVPVIGFVNAGRFAPEGQMEPARVAVLQQWIDAGQQLGNHTFSHIDFDETTVKGYIADTQYGDSLIRALLLAAHKPPPMWFRHPYLHTGRDSVTRARFESWLAAHGYRVAPVTVNSDEYLYAARYARLAAHHDSAGMQKVAAEYLSYMTEVIARCEQRSNTLFGRDIRQILLLHANLLNADHFADLARMYQGRGYQFIPIERAMEDSVYRRPDHYYGPEGLSWLGRWAREAARDARGRPHSNP
jgi:peptidoglycan/xylan/chitin deacetylase (PgdA/CDA1 family)